MEKTSLPKLRTETRPLPKQPETRPSGDREPQAALPPQTPADIPGLGPIRVRALQKAGFDTLDSLRTASLEDLLTVPGLSEIKARHIQTYLAQFPALPETRPKKARDMSKTIARPAVKEVKSAAKTERAQTTSEKPPAPEPLISPTRTLASAAERAMGHVTALLSGSQAQPLRPRLQRELTQLAPTVETLQTGAARLPEKAQERAAKQLQRLVAELSDAGLPALDHKAQGRLADSLAKANAKLAALV